MISQVVGFEGKITFDETKPDGAPRKLLDVSYLKNLWVGVIKLNLRRTHFYIQALL